MAGNEAPGGGVYNGRMRAFRPRFVVGFDASGVAGAAASGRRGSFRVRAFASAPLPPGTLVPGPAERNLVRPDEVREALVQVAAALEAGRAPAALILPAGTARIVLLDLPSGVTAREYARYRLGGALPYPAEEAVVDVLRLDGGRMLAAAVRRAVLQEYEDVAAAAGLVQERLDLAPLAALAALLADRGAEGAGVDVILGDAAVSFASHDAAGLRAFRTRLRDAGPGEAERLRDEADRTAAGNGGPPLLRVVGPGAGALLRAWAEAGRLAVPGWQADGSLPVDPAELAWLGGALG